MNSLAAAPLTTTAPPNAATDPDGSTTFAVYPGTIVLSSVGWVERSETHRYEDVMGFAALNPSYAG